MASKLLSLLLPLLLASAAAATGPVNITGSRDIAKILDQFPNFSTLNQLLTQTKVADQIDSRQTITVLAVANSAISPIASLPADAQQKVLALHVVLDYFDINKITNLPNATALLTTLFQASGKAAGKSGFLNATDVGDGQVMLGSAADGGTLTSEVVREIAMQPYNISVIEITQPIVPPGIASSSGGGSGPTPGPAPKEAPAVPPPKASTTSPSPSATSPSPKANSSDESPAPTAADIAPVTSPAPSSTAPSSDAPAGPADAPAGSADEKKASSASRRFAVGAGIGAAMAGAAFLVAP